MTGARNPTPVSADMLALLIDSMTEEGLFLASAEGTILSWNAGAVALTGLSTDQAVGHPCPEAIDLPTLALHWPHPRDIVLPGHLGESIPLRAVARLLPTGEYAVRLCRGSRSADSTLRGAIQDAVIQTDLQGVVTSWNQGATRLLGWTGDELLGRPLLERFPLDARPEMTILLQRLASSPDQSAEFEDYRKDGSRVWVAARLHPIRSASGQLLGWLGIYQDITARKLNELSAQEQSERLRVALHAACLGVWQLDLIDDRVHWSPEVHAIVGVDEFDGRVETWHRLVHPDDLHTLSAAFQRAIALREFFRSEFRIMRPDGKIRWVSNFAIIREDAHGTPIAVIGTIQDITERKMGEIALRESEDRLRLALRAASAIAFVWEIPTDRVYRHFSTEPALGPTGDMPDTLARVRRGIHPDDRAHFDAQVDAVLHEGTQYHSSYRVVRPSSEVRWLEEWGLLERDSAGHPLRLTGVSIDVTERKRAEQTVFAHNRVLERIAAGAELSSTLNEVALLVEEQLPGAHCAVLIHHPQDARLTLAAAPHLAAPLGAALAEVPLATYLRNLCPSDDRFEAVLPIDLASDPHTASLHDLAGQQGLCSCLIVPIRTTNNHSLAEADRILGLFVVLRPEPGDPSPPLALSGPARTAGPIRGEAFAGAAHLARVAIEKDRAQRALRESEERFRSVLDNLPALIYLKDLQGRYLFVNRCTAETLGVPQAEWIGRTARQLLPPALADQFDHNDQHALQTLAPYQVEETGLLKDGREITNLSILFPLFRPDGSPYALCGISTDITARVKAEEERNRLWNLTPHFACIAGFDGFFKQVNPSWSRILGWSDQELLAHPYLDFVHPDDHEATRQMGNQLLHGHAIQNFANRYRCKDGSFRWITWTCIPFAASRSIYGFARDVTEEKQLEEKFRQAQKMEAIGRLAGGVAHDFNNLLTVINGYSEILLPQFPSKDPRREMLGTIRDAGDRAATLTAQLLAFSRKAIVEPRVVDLNQVVDTSSRMLRRLIGEDVTLHVQAAPSLPLIKMDTGQLDQVLINLAVNARDAMPQGGALTMTTSTVQVAAGQIGDEDPLPPGLYVQLTIADTGCGMPPTVRQRIFEPFFTTKSVGKGTGLGLATVYGIIKQAGGSITVESEPDQGATFRILLPALPVDHVEESAASADLPQTSGRETILLVEDEIGVRSLTRQALQLHGYTVIEVPTPLHALSTLTAHPGPIHLLLTDVVMPEMSGLEVARRVRSARPGIRVLYMSGYFDEALRQHGLDIGVDSLLVKPFSLPALACKVREVLDSPTPTSS